MQSLHEKIEESPLDFPVKGEEEITAMLGNWKPFREGWIEKEPHFYDLDAVLRVFLRESVYKAREDALREVDKGIGMVRQWLNEDRISDPKKIVTNEQIKTMLQALQEKQ